MSTSISKNGIIESNVLSEFILNTFDTNFYVEPDNSVWIRIFHHNNPANARFDSSDTFTTQVYKDADRWFNVKLCDLFSGPYELMIKQKTTSDATEAKYRWIQTTSPMGGDFESTKAANITKITTSGYNNIANSGGIYLFNYHTYLVTNNSSNGNWHGAIGCWTIYQEGIPGYHNSIVTTGYMDLYLRIDDKTNLSLSSFDKNFIKLREIVEY